MEYINGVIMTIEPFLHLDPERLEKTLESKGVQVKRYQKDQLIHLQDEECSKVDVLVKGAVDIHSLDLDGNTVTLARFGKGDMVGINLLFSTDSRYPFSVTATEDAEIVQISMEIILEFSKGNMEFTGSLLRIVSDKALSLANWITQISMKPLRDKILDFIRMESRKQGSARIVLPFTKKDLAERLGVQRTSLSRELQKMREEGIIDFDRTSMELKVI